MNNYFSIQLPLIENRNIKNKFKYEEIPIGPQLSDFIYCLWSFRSDNSDGSISITLTPDPCISVIIDLNNISDTYILGPVNKLIKLEIPQSSNLFGIKFLPGRFSTISPIPINGILNNYFLMDDTYYDIHKYVNVNFRKYNINDLQSYAEQAISNIIEYRMVNVVDVNTLDSIKNIYESKGNICISDLAQMHNCSIRTLSRKFDTIVGINPKLMCRIIRFQYFLLNYSVNSGAKFMELALDSGYYDQSHFTRDFKEFIGVCPSLFTI